MMAPNMVMRATATASETWMWMETLVQTLVVTEAGAPLFSLRLGTKRIFHRGEGDIARFAEVVCGG
jgi:hypothetical protein